MAHQSSSRIVVIVVVAVIAIAALALHLMGADVMGWTKGIRMVHGR